MPSNPERRARGGDVEGQTRIDVTQGEAIPVATASFEGGYGDDVKTEGSDAEVSKADLVQGYSSYGKSVGEGR